MWLEKERKGKKLLLFGKGVERGILTRKSRETEIVAMGNLAFQQRRERGGLKTEVSKPAGLLAALISNKEARSAGRLQPLNLDSALHISTQNGSLFVEKTGWHQAKASHLHPTRRMGGMGGWNKKLLWFPSISRCHLFLTS